MQGRRTTLVFEIGSGYVKLIERDDAELAHLVNREMVPGKMLMELQKCGLHMMPDDQDAYYAGVQNKSRETEERAILDIATGLNAFSFRSSKWNRNVEPNNIIVKIRENLEFDREFFEDYDQDWRYMMWHPNKVHFVNASDEAEVCNTTIPEGCDTHSIL